MPPIKPGLVLRTAQRNVVEEVSEKLYSPAKLEALLGPPKGYSVRKAAQPRFLEVDPPQKLILKQRQPKYIEVDEPLPTNKPTPRPPNKLYHLPNKPSEIVEAARDAKDFWMPDPKMFPGSELLVKVGNAGLTTLLRLLAEQLKKQEKLRKLAASQQKDNYENPPSPYGGPKPPDDIELPLPDNPPRLPVGVGNVDYYIDFLIKRKYRYYWVGSGDRPTPSEVFTQLYWKRIYAFGPIEQLYTVTTNERGTNALPGNPAYPDHDYNNIATRFSIAIYYPADSRLTNPADPRSKRQFVYTSIDYHGDIVPYDPTQPWYLPGVLIWERIEDIEISPDAGSIGKPELPRLIVAKRKKKQEDEMPCDLSSVQQLLRYNIAQNNQIKAAVNSADLAIKANIDTLKPPIAQTLSNTNSISSSVGELLNVTGTTQTTVNSTANTADAIKQGIDNIPPKLNGIQSALDDMAPKTNSIKSTVDAIAPKVDDIKDGLGAIGRRIDDVWSKLGDIANQIGDRFDKLARWLRLPQLLSALTLIVTLHNAAMLSSNLITSLGEIIDVGLDVIGLKDENDASFNISEILGKSGNNLAASVLGESNWNATKEAWKKINNIYKAAANVIWSLQSIFDSMISIVQVGAECTGKIGNALRKAGVVAEDAYSWLPEQINMAIANQTAFRGVLANLRNLNETADSLSTATSETKNIQDEFNELKEKKDKFDAEVKKVVDSKTASESTIKTSSQSPSISSSDLRPGS